MAAMTDTAPDLEVAPFDEDEELAAVSSLPTSAIGSPPEEDETAPLMFEGRVIDAVETKITGVAGFSEANPRLQIDDRVRFVVESRVTAVNHFEKDGKLIRQHTVKAIIVEPTPWNPDDPNDRGILRA